MSKKLYQEILGILQNATPEQLALEILDIAKAALEITKAAEKAAAADEANAGQYTFEQLQDENDGQSSDLTDDDIGQAVVGIEVNYEGDPEAIPGEEQP